VLNVNSSNTAEDTNFKFGRHAPKDSADRMPEKLLLKEGVAIIT